MIDPAEAARKKRRHRNERIAAALVVLVVAAGTLALTYLNGRAEEEEARERTYIPTRDLITPETELLREYVRIDTSTPEGIAAAARWLAGQLQKRGVRAEIIESTPGYLNVFARIKGREPGNALLLFNHIDVVPAGAGWSQPPFEGKIVLNELYGRGALDMKSIALCQLLAFADVARGGRVPKNDLIFLATAEEEQGSANGMRWLLEHRPDLFEGVRFGITEGGITEVMSDQMSYFGIEVGGKQVTTVRVEADSAEQLRQARFELQRYVSRRDADRVLPGVRRYFRDIAPTRVSMGPYLANIDATIADGKLWMLPVSYREHVQDSVRVGPLNIDGQAGAMSVRLVNLADTDPEQRVEWLRGILARYGARITNVQKQGPVPLTSADTPLFRILGDAASRQYKVRAGTILLYNSLTDCRLLRTRGIACYGVAPFRVNVFQSKAIHGVDERVRLDWFVEGIAYMRTVVEAWAYGLQQ